MADLNDSTVSGDSSDSTVLSPSGGDPKVSLIDRVLGVTNALAQIGGIATAAGAAVESLEKLVNTLSAPSDFIVPDLANNGSTGFGFLAAAGGAGTTPTVIREVDATTPHDAVLEEGLQGGTWEALDFMINKTLNENWVTQNGSPGNPNIMEAYRLAGRAFTRDGGTGQYSWAAAYVTYILSKSGFTSLQTMAPSAYGRYGTPVDFRRGPIDKVRKWDVVVFTSDANIQHVGFVKNYDPDTGMFEIVGGDQAETVKVTQMPYSATDPRFRTIHVRRNWAVPPSEDRALWLAGAQTFPVPDQPTITATYLDAPGVPVVTGDIDTDTLIHNADTAINASEATGATPAANSVGQVSQTPNSSSDNTVAATTPPRRTSPSSTPSLSRNEARRQASSSKSNVRFVENGVEYEAKYKPSNRPGYTENGVVTNYGGTVTITPVRK